MCYPSHGPLRAAHMLNPSAGLHVPFIELRGDLVKNEFTVVAVDPESGQANRTLTLIRLFTTVKNFTGPYLIAAKPNPNISQQLSSISSVSINLTIPSKPSSGSTRSG